MILITDTRVLADFCRDAAQSDFVTVDTEFLRERTYWPRLCVIQIAGENDAVAVDALAPGIDLAPVFALMADKKVLKVFHAARQDLEIFLHLSGRLPDPLFDTQIAAMVCGFGESVGYETLVASLAKKRLDKGSRFTDWTARPLTERQIAYALADVTHLHVVYEKLRRKLDSNGRAGWLDEEMATLTDPATYEPDPRTVYRRIRTRSSNPRFLAALRELAAWREGEAQRLDIPRNHVLRDEALIEIAHHLPKTPDQLARTRGLGRKLAEGPAGKTLLEAVAAGQAVPDADCPQPSRRPDMPRGLGPVVDLLKVLLKMRCEEAGVAQKLVASGEDLEHIAAYGPEAEVPVLRGWRRDLFGNDALKLCRGKTALVIKGKRLTTVKPATT